MTEVKRSQDVVEAPTRWPMYVYWTLPPVLVVNLIVAALDLTCQWPGLWLLMIPVVTMWVVGIPVMIHMFRGFARMLRGHQRGEAVEIMAPFMALVDLMRMFRLPAEISRKHRWFHFFYYGSIVAYVLLPFIYGAADMASVIWRGE